MRAVLAIALWMVMVSPSFANCDSGEKIIRFGAAKDNEPATRQRTATLLRDTINRELQGKFCMQIVNDESRFSSTLAVTAIQAGDIEMAAPTLSTLARFASPYQVFDLPLAFRDYYAVQRFAQNSDQVFSTQLQKNDIVPLGILYGHFSQISAKRPVFEPNDVAGLKFRLKQQSAAADMLSSLKATTQIVPENNLSIALKTGRIDAQITNWEQLSEDKTASLLKGVTETNHRFEGYQLIASQPWLKSLDAETAKALSELISRMVRQSNFETERRTTNAKRSIMRSGVAVRTLTRNQRNKWRNATASLWAGFKNDALLMQIERANSGL